MPDIEALNGVAAGSIEAVNGVAKADIQAINGCGVPASGASLWCVAAEDGGIATAAASDLNDWTGYDATGLSNQDHITLAYGKDGSGGPLWVVGTQDGNREIRYSADPTDGADWSDVNIAGDVFGVAWGNNVWVAVGQSGEVHRSTNGTSWTQLDLSGVTGYDTNVQIWDVASDGAGKWMFSQAEKIFMSTNDGSTWAMVTDLGDASGLNIGTGFTSTSVAYTAGRWSVFLYRNSAAATLVCHAAAADTSAWAVATLDGSALSGVNLIAKTARRMAAGGGTVIIVQSNAIARSTNGGQDFTRTNGTLPRVDARDVASDGQGTWIAVHDSGRVSVNASDGAPGSWAEQTGGQLTFPSGTENIEAVASNVLLPT